MGDRVQEIDLIEHGQDGWRTIRLVKHLALKDSQDDLLVALPRRMRPVDDVKNQVRVPNSLQRRCESGNEIVTSIEYGFRDGTPNRTNVRATNVVSGVNPEDFVEE